MAERAAIAEGLGFHEVGERIVSFELKPGEELFSDRPNYRTWICPLFAG